MRVADAKKVLPDIRLVHVKTLGADGTVDENDDTAADPARMQAKRSTHKACLDRYRYACEDILAVIHKEVPNAVMEKVGWK